MADLTIEQRAYLAGLFDGEGYVGIERAIRKERNTIRRRVVIVVSNTNWDVVQQMKNVIGHGWISVKKYPEDKNWKPLYLWTCKGGSARYVLSLIVDWLQIKKPQAELALDGPDTDEKWLAIKMMNHRGKLAEEDVAHAEESTNTA